MDTAFVTGMLVAWVLTQTGFGVFFVIAYAVSRREEEYLLFGLLCLSLAVATAGGAYGYAAGIEHWPAAMRVLHAGVIVAAAMNLHFVMRYARVQHTAKYAGIAYALAAFYELINAFDLWWKSSAWRPATTAVFGFEVHRVVGEPTWIATTFYLAAVLEVAASVCVLYYVWRSGKREALSALLAMLVVCVAIANDVALVLGAWDSVLMLPHVAWIYGLAVAGTLLVRYRAAAGELEQTESHLRRRTEQLRHSYAELREMHDELTRKQQLAAVGELAAAIAHEVRNPLAIIVNAVSGLRRSTLREEDRQMLLGIVDEETARLDRLVADLLRFARPVKVQASKISLVELAQRVESMADDTHTVTVHVDDEESLRDAQADPGLLWLVFDNLVSNALQATPHGGAVDIMLSRSESEGVDIVHIEVKDDGQGMDERTLERALHPFFTTRPSGTGLGLPIVQRIVEAHGGRVEVESAPGVGTTVALLLPLFGGGLRASTLRHQD